MTEEGLLPRLPASKAVGALKPSVETNKKSLWRGAPAKLEPEPLTWMRMGKGIKNLLHEKKLKRYEKKLNIFLAISSLNRRSKHVRTRKMVNYT